MRGELVWFWKDSGHLIPRSAVIQIRHFSQNDPSDKLETGALATKALFFTTPLKKNYWEL